MLKSLRLSTNEQTGINRFGAVTVFYSHLKQLGFVMNKVTCIALIALLLPSISVPAPTLTSERAVIESDAVNSLSISFDLTGIDRQSSIIDNQEYIKVSLEGEGVTQKAGMPELPAVSRYIIVPPDKSVELVVTRNPELQVHADMPPSAVLEQPGIEDQLTTANISYYADGGLYPAQPAEISRPILIRHVRLVKVTVYPVQYNPRTQSYIERPEVGVELRFRDGEVINPANVSFERIPSPQLQILLESLALNPAPRRDPRELVEARGYNEYFLFVIQDDIDDDIEDDVNDLVARLVEWKRRSGNKVEMLRIENERNPGDIEDEIQDRYDELLEAGIEPFDNLLLIGEDEERPYSDNCRQGFDLMLVGPTSLCDTSPWVDHYDVKFGQLEGDDLFPDVAVNRFHSGDLPTLAGGVNKTINYQSEPYMEDTDWYTEAVVEEQNMNGSDQTSTYCVDYYVEALERNGFDVVAQWRRANGDQGGDPGPWLADRVNELIGCIAGRAKNYTMDYVWGHSPQNMFDAVGVFPIAILNSGHGEWAMETLWWVGREEYADRDRIHDIQWAKGAVAATCTWSRFTDNHYNTHHQNTLGTAMVHGMLDLRLSMGWSRVFTLLNFARTFPDDDWLIEFYCSNFGCCGDPAIRYWRGVPRLIEVDHPDHLAECGNYIPVLVYDEEDEEPIEGIEVTVYKGDMDEVEWFETKFTDADGFCEFIIDPELEGPILITALETDVYPYMGEIDREETNVFVQASITVIDDSEGGNDDDIVNPGETIELSFAAGNFGVNGTARNVIGTLTSSNPALQIEDNHIIFGDIESGGSSEGDGTAAITVAASCPDGIPIDMLMQLESDDGDWISGFRLDPVSFDIEVAEIENDGVVPRGIEWMDIELRNIGRLPIPAFTARILSSGWELGAPVATSDYDEIPVDGVRGPRNNGFRLSGNLMAIPGTILPVTLLIEVSGEVVDSAFCHLQISEPYEGAPQGPDAYGYICFDDTDTDFDQAPEYEWIEVCADADWELRGTCIDDYEGNNSNGYAVVDLPFIFQYYGEEFDQITVCTNGFLTAGTDPNFVPNFQNFPLEGGGQSQPG